MTSKIAVLWDSEVEWSREKPFSEDHLNSSYEHFSRSVNDEGGEMFIAKYSWWKNGLEKAFVFREGEWIKVVDVETDVVFDKYRFDDETVPLKKKLGSEMSVLNPFKLEELCKDKLLTYEKFPDNVAETLKADKSGVRKMLGYGKAVVKPRYDFGGKGVEIIESMEEYEPGDDLLVQRFVDSGRGIPSLGIEGAHDLRVIVMDGKPLVSYVREPESGLISNVHQGGSMKNVGLDEVPDEVFKIIKEVDQELESFSDRLYSIDFIFDEDEEPWILELNSKPGLVFYDEKTAEWKKPLMDEVAEKLVEMS